MILCHRLHLLELSGPASSSRAHARCGSGLGQPRWAHGPPPLERVGGWVAAQADGWGQQASAGWRGGVGGGRGQGGGEHPRPCQCRWSRRSRPAAGGGAVGGYGGTWWRGGGLIYSFAHVLWFIYSFAHELRAAGRSQHALRPCRSLAPWLLPCWVPPPTPAPASNMFYFPCAQPVATTTRWWGQRRCRLHLVTSGALLVSRPPPPLRIDAWTVGASAGHS